MPSLERPATFVIIALCAAAPSSLGGYVNETIGTMPARMLMASAQADDVVYLFGGFERPSWAYTAEILKVDLESGTVTPMAATLPTPRGWSSAVWTGEYAYVFGGHGPGAGNVYSDILRYDPATDQLVKMAATFPSGAIYSASAIWDPRDRPEDGCANGCAYIFGGGGSSPRTWIFQYHPPTDTLRRFPIDLPEPGVGGTAAVYVSGLVYILGGDKATDTPIDRIVRFDPVARTAEVIAETLPEPRTHLRAVWTGSRGILVGGYGCAAHCVDILAFDPASEVVSTFATRIPSGAERFSAAWDAEASRVVMLGDWEHEGTIVGKIVNFHLRGTAVASLASAPLKEALGVRLDWTAPPDGRFAAPVLGYTVWHVQGDGSLERVADLPGGTASAEVLGGEPGETRCHRVSYDDADGPSELSGTVCSTLPTPPPPPQGFEVAPTPVAGDRVLVRWDPATPDVIGYLLFHRSPSGEQAHRVDAAANELRLSDLKPGSHTFWVHALNAAGVGDSSPPKETFATGVELPGPFDP